MWEAASGGRTRQRASWRFCRETSSGMFSFCFLVARIVLNQSFSSGFIFRHAARSPAGGGLPHWSDLRFCRKIKACSEFIWPDLKFSHKFKVYTAFMTFNESGMARLFFISKGFFVTLKSSYIRTKSDYAAQN
jgi:hypothetical protein